VKRATKGSQKSAGNGTSNGNGNGNGSGRTARRVPVARPESTATRVDREDGERPRGTLVIIGGHEDKERDRLILRAVAERVGEGALVVITAASGLPAEVWADYEPVFKELGVRDVRHLHVSTRAEARTEEVIRILDGATAVFITGGDQLKLTSQLGDTPVYSRIMEIYENGGTIAGTSAGASVMCETMLVEGRATPRTPSGRRCAWPRGSASSPG
jgi:cyanophycinase